MNSHRIVRYALLAVVIVILALLVWVLRSRWSCHPIEQNPVGEHATATGMSGETQPPAPLPNPSAGQSLSALWKSETTGKEYRVEIDQDRFSAEWVNIPPEGVKHGAYIRSECRRVGSKWVGTTRVNLPCSIGEGAAQRIGNTCRLQLRIEILSMQPDRITGRGESLRRFDCQTCRVDETGWGDFVWVPKTPAGSAVQGR